MKRRLIILVGLVFLAGIGLLVFRRHDNPRRALEDYKKQLIAKGEKLTIAELIPPPSNKTPNGAGNFLSLTNVSFSASNIPAMMRIIAPGVAMISHTNSAPELTLNYQQNTRAAAALRETLDVAVLDFNIDYSKGAWAPLPHLAKLKPVEQLAAVTAVQAIYVNDHDEAWLDLNAAVDPFRLIENDFAPIAGMIRISLAPMAVAVTWEALQSDQLTDAQLSALQAKWLEVDFLSPSEATLAMERAISIDMLIKARTTYEEAASVFSLRPTSNVPAPAGATNGLSEIARRIRFVLSGPMDRHLRYPAWKSSWSYAEESYYLQMLGAAIEASRRTKVTGAFAPAIKEFYQATTNIDRLFQTSQGHFRRFGTDDVMNRGKILAGLADLEVARRLLVTAIALKRFQLQHAAYPTSLAELAPAFLPHVPADLMDGKPLRYRLRPEGGFLLYSVGEDGADNGGDATPAAGKGWLQGRDIVWPRPATAAEAASYLKNALTSTNAVGRQQ